MDKKAFYYSLSNDDQQTRVDAVRKVVFFAGEIGFTSTYEELLPLLRGLSQEDEDEVLLVLAEEMGKFYPVVDEDGLETVLLILESLAKSEEAAIREKSIASITALSSKTQAESFSVVLTSLVLRLGNSEWYTPKITFCYLFALAYSRAQDNTTKSLFINLLPSVCKDETPMVRRAAASNLKDIIPLLPQESITNVVIDLYKFLASDSQDSVRLHVIEIAAALAASFVLYNTPELSISIVKPVLIATSTDSSWRVRYMVADCFVTLCKSFSNELVKEVLPVFVKLLCDPEQEVRTAAAGKASGLAHLIPIEDSVQYLLPSIQKLATDNSQAVRLAVASDAMMFAPILGKDATNSHLISILFQLLKDDTPDVRLRLIGNLDQLLPVVGLGKLSENVIPAITELGQNKSWRIRQSVLEYIPSLSNQLTLEYFSKNLCGLCFGWLTDTVYAVRAAAVTNLKKLTLRFGEEFTVNHVLPKIHSLMQNKNYLHRITVLFYAQQVGGLVSNTVLNESIIPLILTLAVDPVANIRYSSANAIEILHTQMDKNSKEKCRQTILKLIEDSDPDVKVVAANALKTLNV